MYLILFRLRHHHRRRGRCYRRIRNRCCRRRRFHRLRIAFFRVAYSYSYHRTRVLTPCIGCRDSPPQCNRPGLLQSRLVFVSRRRRCSVLRDRFAWRCKWPILASKLHPYLPLPAIPPNRINSQISCRAWWRRKQAYSLLAHPFAPQIFLLIRMPALLLWQIIQFQR